VPLSPQTAALLAQLQREIIPAEGEQPPYGIPFTAQGYEALLMAHRGHPLTPALALAFTQLLDVRLPCCEFERPLADEKQNCGCGHHLALYGLSKTLLSRGYTVVQTQAEIGRWARYMYPKEALKAELERRAAYDPNMAAALEELKSQGAC